MNDKITNEENKKKPKNNTHYDLLEKEPNADKNKIQIAHLFQAIKYHSDFNTNNKQIAEKIYKKFYDVCLIFFDLLQAITNEENKIIPKNNALYDLLEIEPNADKKEILKAFLFQINKCHTDSKLSNEEKDVQMHNVNLAFEILSDPVKRKEYDIIVSGDKFVSLIGKPLLDLYLKKQNNLNDDEQDKDIEIMHRNLLEKCNFYVNSRDLPKTKSQFELKIYNEIDKFCNEPFAKELLNTIGCVYKNRADQILNEDKYKGLSGLFRSLSKFSQSVSNYYEIYKTTQNINSIQDRKESPEIDDKTREELDDQIKHLSWKATVLEIKKKTHAMLDIYLSKTLSKDELLKRSEAVAIIGQLYSDF